MTGTLKHTLRPAPRAFVTALVALLVAVTSLAAGCSADGPLDPSGPGEAATRAARLAGFERAASAERDGVAVIGLEVPGPDTVADVHLAVQIGFATLAATHPSAESYEVG